MQSYANFTYQELTEKLDECHKSIMVIRNQISQAGDNACPEWLGRAEYKKKEFGILIQILQSEKTRRLHSSGVKFNDVFLEVCKESMSSDDFATFTQEAKERFIRKIREWESCK